MTTLPIHVSQWVTDNASGLKVMLESGSDYYIPVIIHQRGIFDLAAEVDVFATHLQCQLRTARNHQLLTDETIVSTPSTTQGRPPRALHERR